MQDKKKETKCEWCGRPVSRDAFGRARRFHPECGKAARSESMKGNKRSVGHGRPRELTAYTKPDSDPVKLRAYGGIPGERLRAMAMAYWGEIGELCYFVFDHANPMLFDQDIPLPLFQVCRVMPYGKCVGQSYTSDVDRPVIDIFLSLWKSKYPYAAVAGVVMHEMLHFHNARQWRERGSIWYQTSHENELWMGAVASMRRILKDSTMKMEDAPYEHWPIFSDRRMAEVDRLLASGKWPW